MLTKDDRPIDDAVEVLESLAGSGLRYVGFKDVGADPERQQEITALAHGLEMEVMIEVVSTSADAEAHSVKSARSANVDWVLGGTNPQGGVVLLAGTAIHYCPFPGTVTGHPSVLSGSIEAIAIFAQAHTEHVHEQFDVIAAMLGKQLPKSSRCSATPTACCSPSPGSRSATGRRSGRPTPSSDSRGSRNAAPTLPLTWKA